MQLCMTHFVSATEESDCLIAVMQPARRQKDDEQDLSDIQVSGRSYFYVLKV